MKILDSFVLKKFLVTLAGTLFLLVVVMILSELTTRMNSILQSNADPIHFYKYLIFRVPRFVSFAVPIAIMFATTFTITQLQRSNELLAIMAAGWGYYRAVTAILLAGVAVTVALFAWNELVVGDSENISQKEWKKVRGQRSLDAKAVHNLHVRGQNTFYYFSVYLPKHKKFKNIHAINVDDKLNPLFEVRSQRASWSTDDNDWIFIDGDIRYFKKNLEVKKVQKFKEGKFGLSDRPTLFEKEIRHEDAMDLGYLNHVIPAREEAGLNNKRFKILWHDRFAIPFVGIVVMLIGALIGKELRHGTLATALGLTILVVLVYFIVQSLGKSLAKDDLMPIWFGAWMATFVYLIVVGVWLFKKEYLDLQRDK